MKKSKSYPELRLVFCPKHPMALKTEVKLIKTDTRDTFEEIHFTCGCFIQRQILAHDD